MASHGQDRSLNERLALDEENRRPWLEPAIEIDDGNTISPLKKVILVIATIIGLVFLAGAIWWVQNHNADSSEQGELIVAANGDYKVAPSESGAPEFQGTGDASYKTSEGGEVKGKIDTSKMPELPAIATSPVADPNSSNEAQSKTADASQSSSATIAESKIPHVPGSGIIHLGAFRTEDAANKAWTDMQRRHASLKGVSHSVQSASVGGGTIYRLSASVANSAKADNICTQVKAAGANCMVGR